MKTKSEIKGKIAKIRKWKIAAKTALKESGKPVASADNAFAMADVSIQALQWALGYKFKAKYYWCTHCQLRHRNPQCPKCHSDNVMELKVENNVTA